MSIEQFMQQNFAPLMALFFQVMILCTSKTILNKTKNYFVVLIVLESILITLNNVEFYFSSLDYPSVLRMIFLNLNFILRPCLVFPFLFLVRSNSSEKDLLNKFDLIPIALLIIVEQFSFFTNWVYYIDDSNIIHRGPLFYVSYLVLFFYVFEFGYLLYVNKKSHTDFNVALVVFACLFIVLSAVIDVLTSVHTLLTLSLVYSAIFFMFALQNQSINYLLKKEIKISQTDGLSSLLNRRAGEEKIEALLKKHVSGAFALVDIDEFKHINDTYGHAVGDEAIIKVSEVFKDDLYSNCVIMRLGGDEFAMFSPNFKSLEEVEMPIEKIFQDINDIMLSSDHSYHIKISMGVSYYDGKDDRTFDEMYQEADKKLYVAKTYEGSYYIF